MTFLLQQRSGFEGMGVAIAASLRPPSRRPMEAVPGRAQHRKVRPPSPALVQAYLALVGGDAMAWAGYLPAHLFPQWSFGVAARCLAEAPFPLLGTLNAGCRLEVRKALPAGRPLHVRAQLRSVDADDRRAVLVTRVTTGTDAELECLVADLTALVRRRRVGSKEEPRRRDGSPGARARGTATSLRTLDLTPADARRFARLTGDLNPIHWSRTAARLAGFPSVILHGFATFAHTFEALAKGRGHGDPRNIRELDARFARPFLLPGRAEVQVDESRVWVMAPGEERPFLTGTFKT